MTYYIGGEVNVTDLLGENNTRYFYALRRTADGTLYFTKVDQLTSNDSIIVNIPGQMPDNFEDFEPGVDFFEGRLDDRSRPYANLYYDQYRWDNKNVYYYLNEHGQLVARFNQPYSYT